MDAIRLRSLFRMMLVLFVPVLLTLDLVFIQFHAGDDEDHFAIAYAVGHLEFGPRPAPDGSGGSGGYVDASVVKVIADGFKAVRFHERLKPTKTPWSGERIFHPPGTPYLPLAHVPQSIAIRIGEALGWTVERTIYAARLVNGAVVLSLLAAALLWLPEGIATVALILLSLPKTLTLMASNSVDPILLAATLLLVAFTHRALTTDWRPKSWHYAIAAFGVLMLGGERPPLVAIGLLPLYVAWRQRHPAGVGLALSGILGTIGWWIWSLPRNHDLRCPPRAGIGGQFERVALDAPALVIHTLHERFGYYWLTFIGEVGYGNGLRGKLDFLPSFIYPLATGMLLFALLVGLGSRTSLSRTDRLVFAGTSIVTALGMFLTMGVSCTAPTDGVVAGIQGRYFMSSVVLLVAAIAGLVPMSTPRRLLPIVVPVFLLITFTMLVSVGLKLYWSDVQLPVSRPVFQVN